MKNIRYDVLSVAAFVTVIAFLSVNDSALAEKKVLKSKIDIVKGAAKTSGENVIPPQIFSFVAEVEPNNNLETAQLINPPSPSSIEGQADTTDAGEYGITYNDGVNDDFEDLFKVTINSPGINVTLTNLQSDLDIFIFDDSLLIRDLSTGSGVVNESITNDTLQAGSYFIAVSIYDEDPDGPGISDFTLIVTGDLTAPTRIEQETDNVIPSGYRLSDNYPNPFNPSTSINYSVPETGRVLVKIYNSLGQEIAALVDKSQAAGVYEINWAGIDSRGARVSSGLYFYKLETENFSQTKKMLLMK